MKVGQAKKSYGWEGDHILGTKKGILCRKYKGPNMFVVYKVSIVEDRQVSAKLCTM